MRYAAALGPTTKRPTVFAVMAAAMAAAVCLACLLFVSAGQAHAAATDALASQGADADKAAASVQVQAMKSATPAKPSKKQLKAFKKASADFSLELFQRCVAAKGKSANVIISPMSVINALAVTANGAAGKTGKQMRKALGGKASMARINKNLRWYNAKLTNSSKARLNVANSIWYHNDGTLNMKGAFLGSAEKYYGAKVAPVDFADPQTVSEINGWVADNTGGMIKRVVSELTPSDRIAIINALYFDAKWRSPFEKSAVQKRKFTTASGKKRTVQMMYGTEHRYIEGKGVTGFMKPYAKGYSYVALLPKKGVSLKKFVASLDGDAFRKLVSRTKNYTVHIAMPKYSLSYDNDQMERQLRAMGMKSAFSNNANFSKMAIDTMGNLHIGQVVHRTKIDVDEDGTKAAAVTAVMMKASSVMLDDVKTVTLNRPFVYAIVDNTTKLPVFMGTVNTIGK